MKHKTKWVWLGVTIPLVAVAGIGGWLLGNRSTSDDVRSSDALNAFLKIRNGLFVTSHQIRSDNENILHALSDRGKIDTACATIFRKALIVHEAADRGYSALEAAYLAIVEEAAESGDGNPITGYPEVALTDDRLHTNGVMISQGGGQQLRDSLDKTLQRLASVYPAKYRKQVLSSITLQVEDRDPINGDSISWVEDNFKDIPVVAALAVLSKLMNDLIQSEYTILQYLKSQVGIENPEFSILRAETKTDRSGNEAKVFLTGAPTAVRPKVYIGTLDRDSIPTSSGQMSQKVDGLESPPLLPGYVSIPVADDGSATISLKNSPVKHSGVIELLNIKTGKTSYYPFETN